MKKVIMAAIASAIIGISAVSTTAMAHGYGKGGQPNFEKMASWMNIAPENRAAFIEVMQAQHEKRVELRRANRKEMQALRADTASKLEGLITPEQLEQFKSLKFGKGRHGHRGGHGMKAGYAGCQQKI